MDIKEIYWTAGFLEGGHFAKAGQHKNSPQISWRFSGCGYQYDALFDYVRETSGNAKSLDATTDGLKKWRIYYGKKKVESKDS